MVIPVIARISRVRNRPRPVFLPKPFSKIRLFLLFMDANPVILVHECNGIVGIREPW